MRNATADSSGVAKCSVRDAELDAKSTIATEDEDSFPAPELH